MPDHLPPLNKIGQTYHDFQVVNVVELPELQCSLIELVHLPTQAQIMHIPNEDPENLFCLSFQTLPHKSDGVAHILEHTVLCGSKKYPVKDPFFAMTRRSLNTFMNALTGADFTCYPAASQVHQDFYNLLSVYLDAVFHPKLERLSFLQEGHRLEFANPFDANSLLEHKGVVFNEMKGALSNPLTRLSEAVHAVLFPAVTYGINAGGSPLVIPELTYEELLDFHKTYYHPSRCLFFFYGNIPLHEHLDFIVENALKGVVKAEPLPKIPLQPRFTQPRIVHDHYPISSDEDPVDKTYIALGWLTCNIQEQQELLALYVLQVILMGTDASPLKKGLLKSGLCKLVSSHVDYDSQEIPWIITLSGCREDSDEAAEKLIRQILQEIVQKGVELDLVEHALQQLEFHRSEIRGDAAPFGLSLFMRSALLKQHKALPEEGLKIHALFEALHEKIHEDKNYIGSLIVKHLLDNPHFVRIIMRPDKELSGKELADERGRLDKIRSQLTPIQVQELLHQAKALHDFQHRQESEDIDVLPKTTLADVPRYARNYILQNEIVGNLNVYHHPTFTNQIVYADLLCDLPNIAEADIPYLKMLTDLLTQLGCGGRSYSENLDYILAHIGEVGATLTYNLQATDYEVIKPTINVRGKALYRQASKLFPLLRDLVTSVDFNDKPRIKEVISKYHTALEGSLVSSAQRYAVNLSASTLNSTGRLSSLWHGLEYFYFIRDLAQNFDARIDPLIEKLQALQKTVFCVDKPQLILTCDASFYDVLKKEHFYGLSDIATHVAPLWNMQLEPLKFPSQGRIIASPVAFSGKTMLTVPYVHPDSPALSVASGLMDNIVLHKRLREEGGAYGGGAVNNSLSGNFYFHGYRDPHIVRTLNAFDESVERIIAGEFTEQDLEEAKLEVVQGMDDPIKPGAKGDYAFSWLKEGRTLPIRQAYRDRLLTLTKADVQKALKSHVAPRMANSVAVIFAGKELLLRENALLASQGKLELEIESL